MTLKNSKVFVIKTSLKTVLDDYSKLMQLADYRKFFKTNEKIRLIFQMNDKLKINRFLF
ncbi:hypothetical protein LCGC14_2313050 [marine sediment metagenome]|uniref:Uncharacterized protein n=1 Tax=marine sediment metagenome TaxID=412755 RepID=A0A0F9D7M6_9ZZZZ